jgi:hypothetical protein
LNKTRTTIAALAIGITVLTLNARAAEARIMDLRLGAQVGGIVGWGSTTNTPDFFQHTRGGGVGFDLGFKILVFDFSANFVQVVNGSGTVGTLTQFLLSTEIDVPIGQAKLPEGQSQNVLHPSFGAGFGFGTPGPVNPPLDAAQISDKGIVSQFKLGYEYYFNPFIAVGAAGLFGYHYFLGGQVITNGQDHSSGYHMAGFATVTFHLGF